MCGRGRLPEQHEEVRPEDCSLALPLRYGYGQTPLTVIVAERGCTPPEERSLHAEHAGLEFQQHPLLFHTLEAWHTRLQEGQNPKSVIISEQSASCRRATRILDASESSE